MINSKPNIFDFATSELSQDAVLLWLLNHSKFKEDKKLSVIGQNLVKFLTDTYYAQYPDLDGVKSPRLIEVIEIKKQKKVIYNKGSKYIDVFCECKIDGKNFAIIIEDKTDSKPHSEQLIAYSETIKKQYPDHKQINIYFKTGYVFEDELKGCRKAGYAILDIMLLGKFLEHQETDNQIYIDYKSYILNKLNTRQNRLRSLELLNSPACERCLTVGYVQYEFLKLLKKKSHLKEEKYFLSNGSSSGRAYAQLRLGTFKNQYDKGKIDEHIFYRIEKMSNGIAISLRQYANVKSSSLETKKEKLIRLRQLIKLCDKDGIQKEIEAANLKITNIRADKKGANSSQILLIYFKENELGNIFAWLSEFTGMFIKTLKDKY